MSRKKLKRMKSLEGLTNVIMKPHTFAKSRYEHYFAVVAPLTLELGCGQADYSRALAQRFPARNFVAVDIKGARLWQAATAAQEADLVNVRFLRAGIEELGDFFDDHTIEEIWLTFPDPFPKQTKRKHRLTSPRYLKLFKRLLRTGGRIHLKTDDSNLFEYTLETILELGGVAEIETRDVHRELRDDELLDVKTTYEKRHIAAGRKIKYVRFHL